MNKLRARSTYPVRQRPSSRAKLTPSPSLRDQVCLTLLLLGLGFSLLGIISGLFPVRTLSHDHHAHSHDVVIGNHNDADALTLSNRISHASDRADHASDRAPDHHTHGHEGDEGLVLAAAAEDVESVTAGAPCPADAALRSYNIAAISVQITLNRYLDYDSQGRMYVLEEELGRVRREEEQNKQARTGEAEPAVSLGLQGDAIQPLVLRVNQGECLQITLRNGVEANAGESVSLHLHGSSLYLAETREPAIASIPAATVAPSESVTYRWWVALDEPEGTHYFHSHGNGSGSAGVNLGEYRREQTSHGLFGALIVEPRGAIYRDPRTGEPLRSGWDAIIELPFPENSATADFREFALIYHEIGNERYRHQNRNGQPVVQVDPYTAAYRPGVRALNYRSEPFMNRLQLQQERFGSFDESLVYSSYSFGDPATPIQQAGMGELASPRLAAAVTNAGGLGMVSVYGRTPAQIAVLLDELRALTTGAVGANFIMQFVEPALAHECVAMAAARVKVVEFFYSEPEVALVEIVHAGGALACWQVGSQAEALAAQRAGCDLIIVQGIEAGGHVRGTIGLLALLSQVLRASESTHPLAVESGQPPFPQSPQSNLILPRSPLIGREHELADVQQLLLQEQVGLLTLTGPGGIGKTRLALQAAANLLDHFVDGVYFIALAPISDAALVAPAIAQTLTVLEAPQRPLQESLQDYLAERQLLLVLDNFEQLLAAAPLVGDLLANCPRLKIMVTSRATLRLYGEQEFPVPPLTLPSLDSRFWILASHSGGDPSKIQNPNSEIDLETLTHYAAVELFVQRARAVRPDFVLTGANAAAVAEICIRLEGLPLAIELAAAKLKLFSPDALLARLKQRLTLLTGGPHDMPARQRTLRAEIAWSYDLLTPAEQTLFRRLAVFASGFTLEAAQAVGEPSTSSGQVLNVDVLAGVTTLLDQNLLKRMDQSGGEPRLAMLETIREYGLEQLEASGEGEAIHRHHASFFLALAEGINLGSIPDQQGVGLMRLLLEQANLRTALAWSQSDAAGTEIAPRLASALLELWLNTGLWSEGRRWLEGALARTTAVKRTVARGRLLVDAGLMAVMQGDPPTAHRWLEEGMAIAKEQGLHAYIAYALAGLGWIAHAQHDYDLAITRHRESLAIRRELGNKIPIASALVHLGGVLYDQHDYTGAQSLYEESLALVQELGAEWDIADVLHYLGQVKQRLGDYSQARALFRESLARWRALGIFQWKGIATCLEGLAGICATQRQFAAAARLFGAAEALREFLGAAPPPLPGISAANKLAALNVQQDEAAFVAAWAEGRTLTPEQAVDYALALPDLPAAAPRPVLPPPPAYPAGLSAREVEVLRLLAQGLTYAQIAEQLIITRRTVNGHVSSIYSKLGVNGRAAATRSAVEHHLV